MAASVSRRKPMVCSSEKRFFTSNFRHLGDWTPSRRATQNWGASAAGHRLGCSPSTRHCGPSGTLLLLRNVHRLVLRLGVLLLLHLMGLVPRLAALLQGLHHRLSHRY